MTFRARLRRFICPSCAEMEVVRERHERTVSILVRSGERLDRIALELQAIRDRMAIDRNPVLGDRREDRL